jgi:plastocyanin
VTALAAALVLLAGRAPDVSAAPLAVAVVDAAGRPVPHAVVTVHVAGVPAKAQAGAIAEIGQRDRQFVPPVSVVQAGTAVSFPNFDTVRHHVYSFSAAKPFELKLYVGTPAAPVVFDRAGLVAIGCNIHDRMQAWLAVVETPHFAVTDADGSARFDLPAGEHRVRAWRPSDGDSGAAVERALRTGPSAPTVLRLPPGAT